MREPAVVTEQVQRVPGVNLVGYLYPSARREREELSAEVLFRSANGGQRHTAEERKRDAELSVLSEQRGPVFVTAELLWLLAYTDPEVPALGCGIVDRIADPAVAAVLVEYGYMAESKLGVGGRGTRLLRSMLEQWELPQTTEVIEAHQS